MSLQGRSFIGRTVCDYGYTIVPPWILCLVMEDLNLGSLMGQSPSRILTKKRFAIILLCAFLDVKQLLRGRNLEGEEIKSPVNEIESQGLTAKNDRMSPTREASEQRLLERRCMDRFFIRQTVLPSNPDQ
jgi:hypothetical protein